MSILTDIKPQFTTADNFFDVKVSTDNIREIDCCYFRNYAGCELKLVGVESLNLDLLYEHFQQVFTQHTFMDDPFDREHVMRSVYDVIVPIMTKGCGVHRQAICVATDTNYMLDVRANVYLPYISKIEVIAKKTEQYTKSIKFKFYPNEGKLRRWESSLSPRNQM